MREVGKSRWKVGDVGAAPPVWSKGKKPNEHKTLRLLLATSVSASVCVWAAVVCVCVCWPSALTRTPPQRRLFEHGQQALPGPGYSIASLLFSCAFCQKPRVAHAPNAHTHTHTHTHIRKGGGRGGQKGVGGLGAIA